MTTDMVIETSSKNYELTLQIDPNLKETEAKAKIQEIADIVSGSKGVVTTVKEPKKIRLSYPINKNRFSYFGILNFSADPEIIENLNTQIQLKENIVRYLLVNLPEDTKKMRILGEPRYRRRPRPEGKKEAPARPKETAAVSGEQLEQEIEKVIEQL